MRIRNLLFAGFAIALMGLAIGVTGQGMIDGVKVDLPYPVRVGDDIVLEPGEYEIRRASMHQDQVLRIFSNDKMRYETPVLTVPVLVNDTPEDTKVTLHHIGNDFYFDKIWIEGKDYGYEFVLPERARALKRELAQTVPATYAPRPQTTQEAPASSAQPAPAPSVEEESAQAELAPPLQTQAERDRQAELAAQAVNQNQIDAVANQAALEAQRDLDLRTAQLQNQNPAPAPSAQAGNNDVSADIQQLPATAANWMNWILGGAALITLSAIVRSRTSD